MKNRVRYLMLVLAGFACVFALASCAPHTAEKPGIERTEAINRQTGPRCNRTAVRILPGKTQYLQDLIWVNEKYVLVTGILDDSHEDKFLYYKLNLKDLTANLCRIFPENQEFEGLRQFDKRTLFIVSSHGRYSIILKGSGSTVSIPLPLKKGEMSGGPDIYLNQNRLLVHWGDRLLQWDLEKDKARSRPEIKTNFGFEPGSCCSPSIDALRGEELWFSNDSGLVFKFDLKTRKKTVVKKGDYSKMHDPFFRRDSSGHTWSWHFSSKNPKDQTKETWLFDLECSEKGQVISSYEISDIQSLFFDKNDIPMVWTKSGSILKLINGRFIPLIESPEFAQKTKGWADAQFLEDGRICLLWRFDADPRLEKVDDPVLKIIDLEKNQFEVMRFPWQY